MFRGVYKALLAGEGPYSCCNMEEKVIMRKNLRSLLLLFLSICQIYIFRIFRDSLLFMKSYELFYKIKPYFFISKTVMILGICISVYQRLKLTPAVAVKAHVDSNIVITGGNQGESPMSTRRRSLIYMERESIVQRLYPNMFSQHEHR
jgi:hypothetical protein